MNYENISLAIFSDLMSVADSYPNERLPKEEQIRSQMFSALKEDFTTVCVERGYGSVDQGSQIECDIWCKSEGEPESWVEIKRCWYGRGFKVHPPEQVGSWEKDLSKLSCCQLTSNRVFVLVALSELNPETQEESTRPKTLSACAESR